MPRFIELHNSGARVLVNLDRITFVMDGKIGIDKDYMYVDEPYKTIRGLLLDNNEVEINHVSYEPWEVGREQ